MLTTFAFTGEYGAGKTYAAKRMANLISANHYALADGIRDELCNLFGIAPQMLYAKPTPANVRQLIVAWGESQKQAEGKAYWCDLLFAKLPANATRITIGDLRFMHELDFFASKGVVKLIYVGAKPGNNAGYDLQNLWHLADYSIPAKAESLSAFLLAIKVDSLWYNRI